MRKINYRDVRSSPPRVTRLSELENDLSMATPDEVRQMLADMTVVTSVNGSTGAVSLHIPTQVQSDWSATSGMGVILNKPILKRSEVYRGVTDASGNYSVTYSTPYESVPHVQPALQAGTSSQVVRITSSTVNGFTVQVTNRASTTLLAIEVLLASTTPVNGASVSVLVAER